MSNKNLPEYRENMSREQFAALLKAHVEYIESVEQRIELALAVLEEEATKPNKIKSTQRTTKRTK